MAWAGAGAAGRAFSPRKKGRTACCHPAPEPSGHRGRYPDHTAGIETGVGSSNLHRFRGDSSLKNPWKLVLSTSQDIQLSCKVAYMPSFNHRGIRLLPVRPSRYPSHLAIMSHKVIMLCHTARVTRSTNLQHGPDIANLDNRISHQLGSQRGFEFHRVVVGWRDVRQILELNPYVTLRISVLPRDLQCDFARSDFVHR